MPQAIVEDTQGADVAPLPVDDHEELVEGVDGVGPSKAGGILEVAAGAIGSGNTNFRTKREELGKKDVGALVVKIGSKHGERLQVGNCKRDDRDGDKSTGCD